MLDGLTISRNKKGDFLNTRYAIIAALSGLLTLGIADPANAQKNSHRKVVANVVFKPTSEAKLTQYVYDTVDPQSANYHRYLTPDEFAQKFGQSNHYISTFKQYLNKHHVHVSAYRGNLSLKVWGTRANVNKAFNAKRVSAKGHRSRTSYKLPNKLGDSVITVIGLYVSKPKSQKKDTKAINQSEAHSPQKAFAKTSHTETANGTNLNMNLTAKTFSKKYGALKFADHYHLSSLYAKGLTGKGQRIGIISFGDFHKKDVQEYWNRTGIDDSLNRIHKIYTIDGAKKVMSLMNASPSDVQIEATLDVQFASSVAPSADIDYYIGSSVDEDTSDPASFFTTFSQAISDNRDQQISTSFGPSVELPSEWPDHSSNLYQYNHALNLIYEQAASQGISIFSSSGDYGPYEIDSNKESHSSSTSPYQVIVGGTTLPYTKVVHNKLVTVPKERAWGDDYSESAKGIKSGIFPGSGGGFSALNPTPKYQRGVSGVNTFRAVKLLKYRKGRYLINRDPRIVYGIGNARNLPDVSCNADNRTGYATYYSMPTFQGNTTQRATGHVKKVWMIGGGTSYGAPQTAAANAVMNSGLTTRIGFWNPQIYKFAVQPDTPFNVLDDANNNNNLYYSGQPGKLYNQATGLGTIDFDKLYAKFSDE